MKRKHICGLLLLMTALTVGSFAGCSDHSSASKETAKKASEEVSKKEEPVKKKKAYEAGSIKASHYESAWLGIQFDAPEGYHMYTKDELKYGGEEAVETDLAEKEKDLSLDMRATSEAGGSISVSVIRRDEKDLTAKAYAESVQKEMLSNDGAVMRYTGKGTVAEEKLAGESYAHLKMEYTLEDLSMCNEMYFRVIDDCVVMIKLEYTPGDTKSRDQMYQAIRVLES